MQEASFLTFKVTLKLWPSTLAQTWGCLVFLGLVLSRSIWALGKQCLCCLKSYISYFVLPSWFVTRLYKSAPTWLSQQYSKGITIINGRGCQESSPGVESLGANWLIWDRRGPAEYSLSVPNYGSANGAHSTEYGGWFEASLSKHRTLMFGIFWGILCVWEGIS